MAAAIASVRDAKELVVAVLSALVPNVMPAAVCCAGVACSSTNSSLGTTGVNDNCVSLAMLLAAVIVELLLLLACLPVDCDRCVMLASELLVVLARFSRIPSAPVDGICCFCCCCGCCERKLLLVVGSTVTHFIGVNSESSSALPNC